MARRLLGFAVALTAFLAVAAEAAAVTLLLPDGTHRPQPYQRWADSAKVPTVSGTITLIRDRCPFSEAHACARSDGMIWMSSAAHLHWRDERAALWHELGHHFDYDVLTDADRRRFRRLMRDRRPWRTPPNSPNERFAEAYRWCALDAQRAPTKDSSPAYGYSPSSRLHRRICLLIAHAGAAPRSR